MFSFPSFRPIRAEIVIGTQGSSGPKPVIQAPSGLKLS